MRFLILTLLIQVFCCSAWVATTAFNNNIQLLSGRTARCNAKSRIGMKTLLMSVSNNRRPIMAGNWKLNPATSGEAEILLKSLASNFKNHPTPNEVPEVIVFPPFPFLVSALELLEGSGIKVGAQNVGIQTSGAYTGEVSVPMIRSLGCDYILLGHSERRAIYKESDKDIAQKVRLCLDEPGLHVILCVGETEAEYESNLLASIVDVQLRKGLVSVQSNEMNRIVIAYEPVWAIGTGKVATPQQAQTAHEAIRKTMSEMFGSQVAEAVRIQYGGSVKPDNVKEIMQMTDVDGALAGGACLEADSFTRIVNGAGSFTGASSVTSSITASSVKAPPKRQHFVAGVTGTYLDSLL